MRPGRLVSLKLKMRAVPGQDCECEDSDKPAHLQAPQLLRGGIHCRGLPQGRAFMTYTGQPEIFQVGNYLALAPLALLQLPRKGSAAPGPRFLGEGEV